VGALSEATLIREAVRVGSIGVNLNRQLPARSGHLVVRGVRRGSERGTVKPMALVFNLFTTRPNSRARSPWALYFTMSCETSSTSRVPGPRAYLEVRTRWLFTKIPS